MGYFRDLKLQNKKFSIWNNKSKEKTKLNALLHLTSLKDRNT